RWLAATHYQTFATRRLFPLLKNNRYVSYNISIKHHKNYTALSNMPVRAINIDKNNMIWTHFVTSPIMPDDFGLMIAANVVHVRFNQDTSQTVKLFYRTDTTSHMIFAYTVILNIALLLKNIFLYIRRTPETNHIAIPKLLGVEEIKLGLILYNETDIIFDQEIDPEMRKFEIIRIIGRKVVHEWFFYNAIFPHKWDPCLSKGFATF
ncbi:Laeverin, partial [Camponotus floridanus]